MKTKIFIILFAIIGLISCNSGNAGGDEHDEHAHEEHGEEGVVTLTAKQEKALGLELGTILERNLTSVIKINGELSVSPSSNANITAIVGGNVKTISVFQGDKVKKGQELIVLEHPNFISLQEDFAVIAHNLEFLEQEYNRQKELFEKNVGAAKDYQKAKSEYNTSIAKYEGLKSRLQLLDINPESVKQGQISNTVRLRSPINGYVNEININIGAYVDEKDIIMDITDNSDLHADFKVYEKDVHLVKEGQKIHFTVANNPKEEYTAKVFAIGKEFNKNSRAISIHAAINEDPKGLIPGMYITGHLHADKKHTTALPNEAIVKDGTKYFIFVLNNNEEHNEHAHESGEKNNHEGHEHNAEESTVEEDCDGHEHDIENNNENEYAAHNHQKEEHDKNEHGGHNHETDNLSEENHDNHKHESENENSSFKMIEVIPGVSDDGYTEIHLINPLPKNTKIVMNVAYYLFADMKKDETEHKH